jgi:hypothetical protein
MHSVLGGMRLGAERCVARSRGAIQGIEALTTFCLRGGWGQENARSPILTCDLNFAVFAENPVFACAVRRLARA